MSSTDHSPHQVRVGILGTRLIERDDLRHGLERHGVEIVLEQTLSRFLSDVEHQDKLDVLLLDLEQAGDDDLDVLEALMEHSPVPMVFCDTDVDEPGERWLRKLADKLIKAAPEERPRRQVEVSAPVQTQEAPPRSAAGGRSAISLDIEGLPSHRVEPRVKGRRAWVLGASFGGPEALKRFLTNMPTCPDAAMIIVQHIGVGFVDVLAGQLARACSFPVRPLVDGALLEHGVVYVAPVRDLIAIDDHGRVKLTPDTVEGGYKPSIDAAMEAVATCYGYNSGAIVFTGMGDDGREGCHAIARVGGVVWAQDSESSIIDSMPSVARATGMVSRSGAPEELAQALSEHLKGEPESGPQQVKQGDAQA